MVTQRDIAESCGVSVSAVSAAFKRPRHLSQEVREKIMTAAKELGYFAEKLELKTIGLVFNNFKNHFFGEYYNEIVYGILERVAELGLQSRIFNKIPERYADVCEINGFLVIGNDSIAHVPEIEHFKMHYLLVECTKQKEQNYPRIYFNNYNGVSQLTEFILNSKHSKIAILNGEKDAKDFFWHNFLKAVENEFDKASVSFKNNVQIYQADYANIQTVEIALNKLLSAKNRPTCIMCSNDLFAYYTCKILKKYRISVPKDISVSGFDGIKTPSYLETPVAELTTVYADKIELGRKSVDVLLDNLRNVNKTPEVIELETELRIGNSVARL